MRLCNEDPGVTRLWARKLDPRRQRESRLSIAVITLFYAVYTWKAFFGALIYLHDNSLGPLQLILREMIQNFAG